MVEHLAECATRSRHVLHLMPHDPTVRVSETRAGCDAPRASPSSAESKILNNLLTRARSWREIEPFYPDQTRGIPKTSESRGIEAVMNAVVLSRRDARTGHLSDDTRTAFEVMWSLQMKTGPNSGAWTWLDLTTNRGSRPIPPTSERRWRQLLSVLHQTDMQRHLKFRSV